MYVLLLIEDSPADAAYIRHLLNESKMPFRLYEAATLAQGVELANDHPIDLVLLDLSIGDSTGLRTLTSWRERVPRLPVVVLTGNDNKRSGQRAVSQGAQDYLVKHRLESRRLSESIDYALTRFHNEAELRKINESLSKETEALASNQRLAGLGAWELDLVSNTMRWRPETFERFGLKPGALEPTRSDFIRLAHREDQPRLEHFFNEAINSGEAVEISYRLLVNHRQLRHILAKAQLKFDEQSNRILLIGTVQEIADPGGLGTATAGPGTPYAGGAYAGQPATGPAATAAAGAVPGAAQAGAQAATPTAAPTATAAPPPPSPAAPPTAEAVLNELAPLIHPPVDAMIRRLDGLRQTKLSSLQQQLVDELSDSLNDITSGVYPLLAYARIFYPSEPGRQRRGFDTARLLDSLRRMVLFRANRKRVPFVVQAAADLPAMLLAEVGTLFQYICSQCERALVNRQGEQPIDLRVCLAQTGEEAQLVFTLAYEGLPPGPAGEALMDMGSVLSLVSGHCPQPAYSRLLDHVCAELEQRLRAEVRLQTLHRGRQQLRLALPVEVLPPLEQLPAEVWGGRALRVLLVEDHPVQQMAIRRLLNKELPMAELAFAANAEQALQLAAESDFDLALVDLELPDMPGWELISSLRKQRPLPVIALTAKASYDEEARALTAGAQAYLQKPLLPAELLPCLQEMLLAHSPQQ
jgi:CheY-like chemotaxis protein